jgi:hypothetical protein
MDIDGWIYCYKIVFSNFSFSWFAGSTMQFLVWADQNLDRFQPWLRTGFITSRAVILRIL